MFGFLIGLFVLYVLFNGLCASVVFFAMLPGRWLINIALSVLIGFTIFMMTMNWATALIPLGTLSYYMIKFVVWSAKGKL